MSRDASVAQPPSVSRSSIKNVVSGSERIRTSDALSGISVFKTDPFSHSGTLP